MILTIISPDSQFRYARVLFVMISEFSWSVAASRTVFLVFSFCILSSSSSLNGMDDPEEEDGEESAFDGEESAFDGEESGFDSPSKATKDEGGMLLIVLDL